MAPMIWWQGEEGGVIPWVDMTYYDQSSLMLCHPSIELMASHRYGATLFIIFRNKNDLNIDLLLFNVIL